MKFHSNEELDNKIAQLYLREKKSLVMIGGELNLSRGIVTRRLRSKGIIPRFQKCKPVTDRPELFDGLDPKGNYWVGFLMADGSVGTNTRVSDAASIIQLGLARRDEAHVEKFKTFLGSEHKIARRRNGSSNFQFQSQSIANKLISLGVTPKKSVRAEANPVLVNSPDFWRGVIDGDGSLVLHKTKYRRKRTNELVIYVRPGLELVGSKPLLTQWLTYVKKHCKTNSNVVKHKSIFKVALSGEAAYSMIRLLYANPIEFLDRKRKKASELLNQFGNLRKMILPG